jgi:SPP1 gp7 family putative phage head morphogenesis protein
MPDNIYQQSFWDADDAELWDEIAEVVLEIYLQGIDGGVGALPANLRVLADWDGMNTAAFEFAKRYRYEKIRGITETTRTQTQKAVSDWIASGSPLDALETALEGVYGASRAERIAQTESVRVYSLGNQEAWESTGLVDEVVWQTVNDDAVCPICGPLNGTHIGIGDIDAFPPAHPGCRCYTLPSVSEKRFEEQLDEILS